MPRSRDGTSASAAQRGERPGSARRPRAGRRRCRSSRPAPVTVSPSPSGSTAAPIAGEQLAQRVARPGWWAAGQSGTVTRPPVTSGGGQERRGVGQVGLDRRRRRRAIGAGRDPPHVRGRRRRPSTPRRAQHRDRHLDVRQRTARRRRRGAPRRPRRSAAPASSSAQTNWRGRRGVDADRAAAHRAAAVHGERQRAAAVVVDLDARARAAPSIDAAASGARARAGRRRTHVAVGECGDRRQEPHDGAGQPAVDAAARAAGRGVDHPVRSGRVDRGTQRAQPGGHQLGVPGAQGAAQHRGRFRERASTRARLVTDFDPGRATTASTGWVATGAAHSSVIASQPTGQPRCPPWIGLGGFELLTPWMSPSGRPSSTSRERRTSSRVILEDSPPWWPPAVPTGWSRWTPRGSPTACSPVAITAGSSRSTARACASRRWARPRCPGGPSPSGTPGGRA